MKIQFVTPWVPGNERPRSLGFLRMLAAEHEVSIVAACWNDTDVANLHALPAQRVTAVRLHKHMAAIRALSAVARPARSLQQAFLSAPAFRKAISEEARTFKPDLAFFHVIRTAHLANSVPNARRVIDLDEFRSGYYDQLAQRSSSPIWRIIGRLEGGRLRTAEDRASDAFESVLVSSPTDLGGPRVSLVRSPHALANEEDEPTPPASAPRIVFVGRMSYSANVDAAVWFAEQVMPRLVAHYPKIELQIVGADPTSRVRALQSSNVSVVGRVPSVAPYYRSATVSIVPVSMATGVQMKLIESLYSGAATVSTPLCAAQAGITNDRECLTADDSGEWVDAIGRLIEEAPLRKRLSVQGKEWAERNYDPEVISQALSRALRITP
jgi:polysaccharide biosynthesis protein PslH